MKEVNNKMFTIMAITMILFSSCNQGQGGGNKMNGDSMGWGMQGGFWYTIIVVILLLVIAGGLFYFLNLGRKK